MEEVMITFDESSKRDVVTALGLVESKETLMDSDGLIITDQNFEEVELRNFGGVLKGSKVFINNDSVELVRFFSSHLE